MSIQSSIHKRLALVLWGSALLAFVLAGAGLALFHSLTLENRVRQVMEPYAQLVSVGTDAAVAFEDPLRAQEILDTLRANPQILQADIFLDNGRILASFNRLPDARHQTLPSKPAGIYLGSDTAELQQSLSRGAHLQLSMSLDQLSQQTHQTLWLFGAGVLVLLTATLGQLLVLRRTIIGPIASLTEATELVRAGADYRYRVPASGIDEVARLGQNFNAMMDAILERENALRHLSRFQRTLLNNVAYGIISTTDEGVVTSFNPAAELLLGYTAEEIIGKQTPALWHDAEEMTLRARQLTEELGETVTSGFEVFTALSRRNLSEEHEWTFIRRDGKRIPVNLSITALRDEDGRITGFVGLTYDLSERKHTQHQLQLLTFALDKVKETIFLMGENDPHFLYANQSSSETLGYGLDELTGGMGVFDIDPDWSEETWQRFWPEFCIQRSMRIESRHRTREGRVFPVEVTANYFEFEGKIYNLAICRDITERKRIEAALTDREREFRTLAENHPDGIVRFDTQGRHIYINSSALHNFGTSDMSLLGKTVCELPIPGNPELMSPLLDALLKVVANGNPDIMEFTWPNGCTSEIRHIPEVNEHGEIISVLAIARDISQRKQAEEALRQYKNQLEETVQQRTKELLLARDAAEAANKAKSVFLANMSHELRTPLNAILGFSSMMRKSSLLQESDRRNIEIINRSGEHLLAVINAVLEMAKIEAGRIQLEEALFDLGGMVRDVMNMMQVRAAEKNLQLVVDQSSEFPRYIVGDQARLSQVLINLVGNALKFTRSGGVTIRLGTKNNSISHLLIEVEDSGPGIASEDQQRVFEPFVQIGQLGDNKGTGLGLSITRQFVQLMKGNIRLESIPGKGSRFTVDLPLKQAETADMSKRDVVVQREVLSLTPGQPEYRILVVEDQLENQLLLANLMESVGFQVKLAENGRAGVALFQSWQPHLIWMDKQMPVMDGLEATKIIRTLPGGKQVKIVAVTASAFAEQRGEILEAGMDEFVRKPYQAHEIYDCLARQLGVQYVYADMPAADEPVTLKAEMLSVLPKDLRRDFENALKSLESERIARIIEQIGAYDKTLQTALTRLDDNYDYPAILKALRAD